jgi:anti-sigma regulatory factor (Ser/Thr protein kinase)
LPLPYDVKSPSLARRFVERFAADLVLDTTDFAACVIATELVTNAVLHGAEPIELTLRFDNSELTVEVTDGDPRIDAIQIRAHEPPGSGGYGLPIIASLADRWGTTSLPSGKSVWATISQTPRA